jgi:hypothetical protein
VLKAVASVAHFDWATFNGTLYRVEYIELEDDDLGPIVVAKELIPKIFITKCSLIMHHSSGIANALKVEVKHSVNLGGVKRDNVVMVDRIACGFVEFLVKNNSKCWPS